MSCSSLRLFATSSAIAFWSGTLVAYADVTISNKTTANVTCSGGVCTATAKKAVLNVGDLAAMLAAGDASVKSGSAKSIDVDQPLSWSTTSRLTLDARQSITVKKPVRVAGAGAVTLTYGGSDGDLQFVGKGKLDIPNPGSSLIINGQTYMLASDVASLAADIAQNIGGNFALANDFNAVNENYNDAPVQIFTGKFEGLGHTISNLNISERLDDTPTGLFGETSGSVVRDIALENISLSANKANHAGAIAGRNSGVILHVKASGKVRGHAPYVGGLVGYNNTSSIVEKSSASVNVSGSGFGGIGGLVGFNLGTIDQSFAAGNVTVSTKAPAATLAGGLVGKLSDGEITNSYSLGAVAAGGGGLIGAGNIAVLSSYSAGQILQNGFSGGFVGRVDSNSVQHAYWDIDTSSESQGCGQGDCSNITGLSDAQLKSGLPAGFDPKIWAQDPEINRGYPYLRNNPPQ